MRVVPMIAAGAVGALALPAGARAQAEGRAASAMFERLMAGALADARSLFEPEQREKMLVEARSQTPLPDRVAALDPESAAATVDRATLGLKTDVKGAEAGIVFAPAILFGQGPESALAALNVVFAALQGEQTRVGVKYAWQSPLEPQSFTALGLKECPFDAAAFTGHVEGLRSHFVAVCEKVVASLPPVAGDADDEDVRHAVRVRQAAQAGCGVAGATFPEPGDAVLDPVLANIRKAVARAKESGDAAFLERIATTAASLARLEEYRFVSRWGCQTADLVAERVREWRWNSRRVTWGAAATTDFFPRKFGFNPAEGTSELPGGEVKVWELRAERAQRLRRTEWALGVGGGERRQAFDEKRYGYLAPSFYLAHIAFRLGRGTLLDAKRILREVDGKPVPHVSLGLAVDAELALSRPDTQDTSLNSLECKAFMDFKISDTLSFRLGVPVKGELAVRKADTSATPAVTELRKIQWSVPVFVVTVLKL
jgi:hypothetical protein